MSSDSGSDKTHESVYAESDASRTSETDEDDPPSAHSGDNESGDEADTQIRKAYSVSFKLKLVERVGPSSRRPSKRYSSRS